MQDIEIIVDETVKEPVPVNLASLKMYIEKTLISFDQNEYAINIVFIDDARMTTLNEAYRSKTGTTDVLTFNLSDDSSDLLEGEIYISVERAGKQAEEYGAELPEELIRLISHGLLHLLGWTHDTDELLTEMQTETERLVTSFFEMGASL